MARRVDWFARMAAAAERIDKWEREASKVARQLERVRRPDVVAKWERAGLHAERMRRKAEKDFAEAERRILPPPGPPPPPPPPPGGYEYTARIDYQGRKGHQRVVELRLVPPGGRRATERDVRRVVNALARNKSIGDWRVIHIRYGKDEPTRELTGTADELQGLLLQFDFLTVGEEPRE